MKKVSIFLLSIMLFSLSSCGMFDMLDSSSESGESKKMSFDKVIEQITTEYSGFYYDQLEDKEKKIYNTLLQGCQNYESEIDLPSCSQEELQKAEVAFTYEHPEFFWINNYTYTHINGKIISITYNVPEDAEETNERINRIADEFVATLTDEEYPSEYDKVKKIYEYIIDTTDYDVNADYSQDIRSVFLKKKSVCAGYARAFQLLCQKIDIPCTYVSGNANGSDHAWNQIYINNNYYWVDVTWGDPVFLNEPDRKALNYDYLCVSDQNFTEHKIDYGIHLENYSEENVFTYPACPDDSLNYYRLQNMYFDTYNRSQISTYITDKINAGQSENIQMKFASAEAYQKAVEDLFTDEYIYEIVRKSKDYSRIGCKYALDEKLNYITLSVYDAG